MVSTDPLVVAIAKAFNTDPILGKVSGPYTDGWQELLKTEYIAMTELKGNSFNRYLARNGAPSTQYVDRQGFLFMIFCTTQEKADQCRIAMKNLFDGIFQPATGGRIMSIQRIGPVTVGHYTGRGGQGGEDNGNLTDSWKVSGTWLFILQRTLGDN